MAVQRPPVVSQAVYWTKRAMERLCDKYAGDNQTFVVDITNNPMKWAAHDVIEETVTDKPIIHLAQEGDEDMSSSSHESHVPYH